MLGTIYNTNHQFDELTTTKLKAIFSKLDNKGIEYYAYNGYPTMKEDDNYHVINSIIVTCYGVIVIVNSMNDNNEEAAFVNKMISRDTSIYKDIKSKEYIFEMSIEDDILQFINDKEIVFNENVFLSINKAIQLSQGISRKDDRKIVFHDSIGSGIKDRNTYVGLYDQKQFEEIHNYELQHTRIRGLAGSGKTIIMLKRIAYLHYKFPNKKIAFIFYTISLKQFALELLKKFYKDFDPFGDLNFEVIEILHGWGSTSRSGFYSKICLNFNIEMLTYTMAKYLKNDGESSFDFACKRLIDKIQQDRLDVRSYDFIFVDEAQDFGINFFKLVKMTLKEMGVLTYAYDELQSLMDDNSVPNKSEIFDESEHCNDVNLSYSYRVPVEILVTAHAIGTGIYNYSDLEQKPHIVNMIEDFKVWTDIGYTVLSGRLDYGSKVVLERKEEKNKRKLIQPINFIERDSMFDELSKEIYRIVKSEDVLPTDILIIDLDSINVKENFNQFSKSMMSYKGIDENAGFHLNLVDKDNPQRVKVEHSITYTTIYRAKGNEANVVFVINIDALNSLKSVSRNMIFTSMTRSRYYVYLMGVNIKNFINEIEDVRHGGYKLSFEYPTIDEMRSIKKIGKIESRTEKKRSDILNIFEEIEKANPDVARELLAKLTERMKSKSDE